MSNSLYPWKEKRSCIIDEWKNLHWRKNWRESNSDEANEPIKELLEKNGNLQEEVRKLTREQEIHSARLCETMEEKNKIK